MNRDEAFLKAMRKMFNGRTFEPYRPWSEQRKREASARALARLALKNGRIQLAKQPTPTRDRYRVHCEVDSDEAMGRVVGTLTRMGFSNVGFELITDVLQYKTKAKYDTTGEDAALAFAKERQKFKIIEMVQAFAEQGRHNTMAYKAARDLTKKGLLNKLGGGIYALANPEPPRQDSFFAQPPASPTLPKGQRHEGITNRQLIWDHIKDRDRFTTTELRDLFKAHARNHTSMSPVLDTFVKEKRIKNVGKGVYDVLKTAAAQKPLRSNGADTGAHHGS